MAVPARRMPSDNFDVHHPSSLLKSQLLRDTEFGDDTGIAVHDHYTSQILDWHNKRLLESRLAIRKTILDHMCCEMPGALEHATCPQNLRHRLLEPVSNTTVDLQQKCELNK